jgi:hypothetical protein
MGGQATHPKKVAARHPRPLGVGGGCPTSTPSLFSIFFKKENNF